MYLLYTFIAGLELIISPPWSHDDVVAFDSSSTFTSFFFHPESNSTVSYTINEDFFSVIAVVGVV